MPTPTDHDTALLQAAADPTRLGILRQLSADGPTCACDLSACCSELSQSTVSHHLRVLREAGWIEGERRGTWIWYAIRPEAVERFSAIAHGIRRGSPRPAASFVPAPEVTSPARAEVTPEMPAEVAPDADAVARPDWRQW